MIAPIVGAVDLGVDETAEPGDGVPLAAHGDDHPPIRIHGDEQFLLPSSGVTGGSGSADDPYRISGWTVRPLHAKRVDSPDDGVGERCKPSPIVTPAQFRTVRLHAIEIVDTTAHVVIENVTVLPRADQANGMVDSRHLIGILLRDADNVTIRNVTVGQADGPRLYRGICVRNSDDLRVVDSTVQRTVSDGVQVHDSLGVDVVGSTVVNATGGEVHSGIIDIETVTDVVIQGNTIRDHASRGVSVGSQTSDVAIHDNVVTDMGSAGVWVGDADSVAVHGNNIEGNEGYGLRSTDAFVNATKNWWGCPDGPDDPDCDGVSGDVDYDPWLTSPNPDAGA